VTLELFLNKNIKYIKVLCSTLAENYQKEIKMHTTTSLVSAIRGLNFILFFVGTGV
jgi:alpha-galactosidase/6-phospho-beta-glucosidase family protein